ncbi:KH domain-containing protein At4g18375-like [Juglans microcarpa x Juglans regia]|uniref:KH domain-containing protein At4g18375-like n=1 Tax=Juglans microcarpa x Juglans regia TaxID=2249226 RepID=UPI001B7D9EB9|nr:KH domain-containing protein At4g18375-like [Juglans microcarpa x Juglans regia]XP_041027607.1 KH domain-containing protein At4g18375-like [Juglans microcarpa x Juglans regia]XP_041027609.1 KH domain-containing protein At4g18375-like [Juglans microcarpa x Juglans regia]XP_041027610.1 KH domain-containing protein At4g18375-like [Juglans microcarpa x Juglans regia]XP_041027611.1 KH domain-containing protein At4g18375-like [Juglans microcarpa x Juglans regia]
MGETGKRSQSQRDHGGDNKNQKRRVNDKDDRGTDKLVVYRILCPDGVIGSVIGKSGKVINSIRQETRAKVKVVDPYPGAKDRVITIYSYVKEKEEVVDDDFSDREPLCAAQDALLKVHAAIANAVATVGDSDNKRKDEEGCQILVPSSQSANIIGKAGATIKKLRSKTRTNIKVMAKDATDPTNSCAMDFDNFVLINGESEAVKKALFAVSAIMYKFTPREEIPLETSVPEAPQSIIIPSDVPIYPPGGLYPSADPIVTPRSVPSIVGATDVQDLQRYADTGNTWPLYSSALPVASGFTSASQSEELIIRVLCPFDKIGRVIGKGGGTIKSIRQACGARIEVDDTKYDCDECVITITSSESPDDLKSMAVEAVLLLQGKINDEDDNTVTVRLLLPSRVIGCITGKSGSIINEIRKRTKADVRISKSDKPNCAAVNDELVEVLGEVGIVRDALIQIVLRLRDDVLKDGDGGHNPAFGADSLFSAGSSLSVSSVLPSVATVAPFGHDWRVESGSGLGMLSSSSLYGYGSLSMGDNGYGSMPTYSSKLYGGLPPTSTLEILVPANAVGKVMGKGGANIGNMRKISGAMIEISDSKTSRGDRIAHITGTPEQKRAAENLVQAFIMAT